MFDGERQVVEDHPVLDDISVSSHTSVTSYDDGRVPDDLGDGQSSDGFDSDLSVDFDEVVDRTRDYDILDRVSRYTDRQCMCLYNGLLHNTNRVCPDDVPCDVFDGLTRMEMYVRSPIYDKYSIRKLVNASISDILQHTGGMHVMNLNDAAVCWLLEYRFANILYHDVRHKKKPMMRFARYVDNHTKEEDKGSFTTLSYQVYGDVLSPYAPTFYINKRCYYRVKTKDNLLYDLYNCKMEYYHHRNQHDLHNMTHALLATKREIRKMQKEMVVMKRDTMEKKSFEKMLRDELARLTASIVECDDEEMCKTLRIKIRRIEFLLCDV